jgi:hypothetical protein
MLNDEYQNNQIIFDFIMYFAPINRLIKMETPDWKNLHFGYMKTEYNIRCYYRNGKWSKPEYPLRNILIYTLQQQVFIMARKLSRG